jgi:hypothetical protein
MQKRKVGVIELPLDVALSGKLVCPNCGDTKFGSTQRADGALLRKCHGSISDEEPCTFSWPDEEDHKYFYVSLSRYLEDVGDR